MCIRDRFGLARQRHVPILPGSDPFPFPDQIVVAGSYGFVLGAALDQDQPLAHLRSILTAGRQQPPTYGRREGPATFVRKQFLIHLAKRRQRVACES